MLYHVSVPQGVRGKCYKNSKEREAIFSCQKAKQDFLGDIWEKNSGLNEDL